MSYLQQEQVLIVGVCGSLRSKSYTRMALKIALQGAAQLGAQTRLIDLREYELAFCDARDDERTYPSDVFRLREDVRKAQGIILGTPEYHGSYTGVLKNALDLLRFREVQGKMIGLLGVSGGSLGAINALNGLRTIGRSLRAWVVPEQISIPRAYDQFEDDGSLKNPRIEERLLEMGRQVTRFAYLHTSEGAREFLRQWEEAQPNPGANWEAKDASL